MTPAKTTNAPTAPTAPTASTAPAAARPTTRVLSDREFVLEHTFHAPAAKVFNAYLDPKMVEQWWGAKAGAMRVETLEPRVGGAWRFVQHNPDGSEVPFHGVYKAIEPVTRLVYTFNAPGNPEILATVELAESNGTTRLTLTNLCATKEQRDTIVRYGAAGGARAAWDRLDAILGSPATPSSPAGKLGYSTLFVADQDRALAFYTKVLGFECRGDAPQPGGHRFIAVNPPGQEQHVVLWPGAPGRSTVAKGNVPGHLILMVEDIDKAFAELKARGATIEEHAPVKAPFASFLTVVDPDGNRIMVQQQAWRTGA